MFLILSLLRDPTGIPGINGYSRYYGTLWVFLTSVLWDPLGINYYKH